MNHFNVTFYATGEIAAIDTFFYGEDENGETRTYLVDYNRKKSSKMTVYINNYAKTDYEEDMCLTPLFELLGNIKVKERVDSWAEETKSHTFGISYSGKRAFTSADSLQVINAESADIDENEDIDGNADTNENSILSQLEYGGEVTGFAVTFSTGGEENTGEIITYIINPKYTSAAC